MWETISFLAGMLVLMMLVALLPRVFDLPDAIGKYFSRRTRQLNAKLLPRDPDEQVAYVLGESLRRAELSSEATARVMAAFLAADAPNRRALANLVAGLAEAGPVEDEAQLLAMLPSPQTVSECPPEKDKNPPTSTDIRALPEYPK